MKQQQRPAVDLIVTMGFGALDANAALDATQGNLQQATDWLLQGNRGSAKLMVDDATHDDTSVVSLNTATMADLCVP
eukprot:COSAG06_NODE_29915_length_548_cov_1.142539_2_plen_76_part_01